MKTSIGFVGLGAMGFGMAKRLQQAGYPLQLISNRNRKPIERLVSSGANEYADVAELAANSDVIILCLPDSEVVWTVLKQMEKGLCADQVIIDTGTSSISETRKVHQWLKAKDIHFAEAPLTGGTKQADAGELGALVGTDDQTYEAIKPILEKFCSSVQHFGEVGTGGCAKMANNYMVFGIVALVHEAFHLAEKAGVSWEKLYDVVIRGSADSGALRRIIGSAIQDDYHGYVFSVKGAHKDMRYITQMMEEFGLKSPLSQQLLKKFRDAEEQGYGDLYVSEILRPDIREQRGGV